MPSQPKQSTKEMLKEQPELQLPKIILQVVGLIFIAAAAAKALLDKDIAMWEGIFILTLLVTGTLMVIPKIVMPVLKMLQGMMPKMGK